jgi:hypothetical protein
MAIADMRVTTSYWQAELQPSRSKWLPSSHCSPGSSVPLPHSGPPPETLELGPAVLVEPLVVLVLAPLVVAPPMALAVVLLLMVVVVLLPPVPVVVPVALPLEEPPPQPAA